MLYLYSSHCAICDKKKDITEIEELGHSWEFIGATDETCTSDGKTEGEICARCEATTQETVPALGHDYKAVVTAPTYMNEGYTTHTCTRCNNSYTDTYVEIPFSGGTGTEEDPYLIETTRQLDDVRKDLNAHYKLIANVVFTDNDFSENGYFYNEGSYWLPIGRKSTPFSGSLDGNGYSIENLMINAETTEQYACIGLFGCVSGSIKNLGMQGNDIIAEQKTEISVPHVGAIAGYLTEEGDITNCYNSGRISENGSEYAYVGAIVGYVESGTISNCYNTGDVFGYWCVGGIAGIVRRGNVYYCYNSGNIESVYSVAGGIAGGMYGDDISICYNTGNIDGGDTAGGIVGQLQGRISNCFNLGIINSNLCADNAGGIVGLAAGGEVVTCYNVGTVKAKLYSGGIIGIENGCSGIARDSYYLNNSKKGIGSVENDNLKACTFYEMTLEATYNKFNFRTVWKKDADRLPMLLGVPMGSCELDSHNIVIDKSVPATTKEYGLTEGSHCSICYKVIRGQQIIPRLTDTLKIFKDIKKNDWYVKSGAIDFVYNKNLFNGTSKTEFSPNDQMTRGMFVTVLGRLHGVKANNNAKTKFVDVGKEYYTGYVKWASDNGIVSGTDKTHFSPEANVNREQICAMMVRYCDYAGITLKKKNAPISFKDARQISGYAKKAVKACQQGAVVNGEKKSDGYYFRPQGNATRAEVATIMMNFYNNYIK